MRQLTIKIPDQKFEFFMELVAHLGLEAKEDLEIPEDHKTLVRERINNTSGQQLLPWQEVRKKLIVKLPS